MPRTMGVCCDSKHINLAVVENGELISDMPERITTPVGLEEHARLWALLDEVDRALDTTMPQRVIILPPEQNYDATHTEFTPRIARETIVRMAAARRSIPVELLARATVRSRLNLPRKGSLDAHLDTALPSAEGRYWRSGRGLAAMAAVAGEES